RFSFFKSDTSLGYQSFCHECGRGSANGSRFHSCSKRCRLCNGVGTKWNARTEPIYCQNCNIAFFSQGCFQAHKMGSKNRMGSKCTAVKKCPKQNCGELYQVRHGHDCDVMGRWCGRCKKKHMPDTWCHWSPLSDEKRAKKLEKQEKFRFLAYDIEAVQGTLYRDTDGFLKTSTNSPHFANVVVCRLWCYACVSKGRLDYCENCGQREWVFRYTDANDEKDK
ncbi:hypothetical protein PMAYCL1PPCAC_31577, partial [Pristionchus mayeri]